MLVEEGCPSKDVQYTSASVFASSTVKKTMCASLSSTIVFGGEPPRCVAVAMDSNAPI
jgi:hypothetical protein